MSAIWSVAEAKAQLSEILRRARREGPQRIGKQKTYVIVTEEDWAKLTTPRQPLGRWLVENAPRGEALELPSRAAGDRPIPFAADEAQ